MVIAVADTHTVLWHLYGDRRLSSAAGTFIRSAMHRREQIGFSSITLAEVVFLLERNRIPVDAFERLTEAATKPNNTFVEVPFETQIARALFSVDRKAVPELSDRIIAATAVHLGVPILSRDFRIRASGLSTIW